MRCGLSDLYANPDWHPKKGNASGVLAAVLLPVPVRRVLLFFIYGQYNVLYVFLPYIISFLCIKFVLEFNYDVVFILNFLSSYRGKSK